MRSITTKTCVWQSFRRTHECFVRKHAFKRERPHRVVRGCGQYEKKFRRAKLFSSLYKKRRRRSCVFMFFGRFAARKRLHARQGRGYEKNSSKKDGPMAVFFQLVEKDPALQRASFSRSVSGIKKASFARFFDTTNSIGSVVPIERLSKTIFFDSLKDGLMAVFFCVKTSADRPRAPAPHACTAIAAQAARPVCQAGSQRRDNTVPLAR